VYSPTYFKERVAVDPTGPHSPNRDVKRVMRGGKWKAGAEACRATYRRGERTGNTDACFGSSDCGVRCVRRTSPQELEP
jgi:formylglycine-generating enzyme required for sulfatase activity